jgi:hypothetical protein
MNANMKAIWTNRALNVVAAIAGIGSVLMGVVAALGDVVKMLEGAGLVPNKYLGIAATLAAVGMAAAKLSKTPSAAIAAAVPPGKAPAPPAAP